MMDDDLAYRRLPARGRKAYGLFDPARYELHLGPDHVLHLRRGMFTETYKRFYFDDIQALVIGRTSGRGVMNLALGVASGIGVSIALAVSAAAGLDVLARVLLAACGATFPLALLAWNTALGSTCRCRLYTAVQTEDLAAMSRLRRAEATLAILRPLIEEAQGPVTPETLDADSGPSASVEASTRAAPAAALARGRPLALRHEHGAYHVAFFWLLLAGGAAILTDVFWQHAVKGLLGTSLWLAEVIVVVLALRRQQHSDLPRGIQSVTWAGLIVLIAGFALRTVAIMFLTFSKMEEAMASPEPNIDLLFGYDLTLEGPMFEFYTAVMLAAHTVVAVLGLLRLREFRISRAGGAPEDAPAVEAQPPGSAPDPWAPAPEAGDAAFPHGAEEDSDRPREGGE